MNTDTNVLTFKFRPYDSQLPIEVATEQRTVKCLYKETKDGKKAGENSYINIPTNHISEKVVIDRIQELAPYVVNFLQSEEDKLVKDAHKAGSLGFGTSWFSLEKVLEALDEAGQGNRLNAEKIEQWFTADMQDSLAVAFMEKLGMSDEPTQEELEKLVLITTAYKDKFKSLASGKTWYKPEECKLLQRALEVTGAKSSTIGERFYARLGKMQEASEDLLLAL